MEDLGFNMKVIDDAGPAGMLHSIYRIQCARM